MQLLFSLWLMFFAVVSCSGQKTTANQSKKPKTTQQTSQKKAKTTSKKTKTASKKPKATPKKATESAKAKTTARAENDKSALLATEPYKTQVIATYYHDKFNGRKTANGTVFDNSKQTAAHRTLPFGTKLKVINRINGKWIYVTVNDRGPVKTTREIDLTKRAFMDITDNTNKGELLVDIEIVKD